MIIPSAEEYLKIISEKAPGALATLHHHRFLTGKDDNKFLTEKSRRNIVFKAEHNSRLYAIRFFLNDDHELFRRYHEVQNYLSSKQLSWKVPFEFLDEEYYPVIKMDWVDGYSFTDYVDLIINDTSLISQLQSKLISLSRDLEVNGIGHGNLNMKHVRVIKTGIEPVLKLIDYDSMYIPSFKGKDSLSAGTSSFQHPMRLSSDFSENIDRFSIWVFLTALEAFKVEPSLWTRAAEHGFDKSKQILFNYRDLAIPQQSRAFQIIHSYNNDELNFYADKLTAFCTAKTLDVIEAPQFYSKNISYTPRRDEGNLPDTMRIDKNPEISKPSSKEIEQLPLTQVAVLPEPKIQKPEPKIEKAEPKKLIPEPKVERPAPKVERPEPKIKLPEPTRILSTSQEGQKKIIENEELVQWKAPEKQSKATITSAQKIKTRRFVFLIAIVSVVAFASVFFIKAQNNNSEKIQNAAPATTKKENVQTEKQNPSKEESVFNQTNLTQFLFGLYQSYNNRNLSSILSNYSENLDQYYDAGAITKNKLSGVINDLFIKPAYYECQPDIRTLRSEILGSNCKLSIAVTETIRADRRSKKENYSSKIEYVVDKSFKILSEKNIE